MKGLLLRHYVKAQILREDHGQDLVEYALLIAMIALAATAGTKTFATKINDVLTVVAAGLSSAVTGPAS